jgi:glycosyltransferase involved in cell wall biosynthesis
MTVAVPTMNGSRHLAETLRGIFAQTGAVFDLLISDDRSEDGTPARAKELAGDRLRVVVNSERLGLAGNWNKCVALCRTPFVAIVHQDDVLHPGHVEAHLRAFADDPAVGLVASGSGVIDDEGRGVPESVVGRGGLGAVDRIFKAGEVLPLMAKGNPLRCSAVSIRAAAHAEAGGFDPALRYVVDWDFWCRVARRWSLAWLAAPTVDVRWHSESETHRFKTGTADLEETERVLAGLLEGFRLQDVPTRPIEDLAHRRLSRAYLNRAYVAAETGNGRLCRFCLRRALQLWPGIARVIAADPRFVLRMAAACLAPGSFRERTSEKPSV